MAAADTERSAAFRCVPYSAVVLLPLLSGYFDLPSISSLSTPSSILAFTACFPNVLDSVGSCDWHPFISVLEAFASWDATGLGLSYRHQAALPTPRRTMQRHPSPAFLFGDGLRGGRTWRRTTPTCLSRGGRGRAK
ncbi:hypothetical protein Zm00014a_039416 [Zea mays]|jgi:hypothetical protein|uniref:Uncharacterized protein n=1 Tax=Zea mays TaxID=4577 RepID=A0A3L6DYR7_MAIZE|nr:hypothetical protein Zm00014a_039416 [Zea mays]